MTSSAPGGLPTGADERRFLAATVMERGRRRALRRLLPRRPEENEGGARRPHGLPKKTGGGEGGLYSE